jgi:hypothetical protein
MVTIKINGVEVTMPINASINGGYLCKCHECSSSERSMELELIGAVQIDARNS